MDNTLYVIDGFGLIFRAYYAFISRPLINSRGENTSAVFGFLRMVFKLIRDYRPECLLIALEGKGKTFRHQLYPEYKANRLKAPEDLLAQIPWILDLIERLGIPSLSIDGLEADDVMASLACHCEQQGRDCRIFSNDKDILQLIGDHVQVLVNKHGTSEIQPFAATQVEEKYGISPGQMADYLSLVGDNSDNVPGVKGIGPKGALKLLQTWGDLDSIYAHLDEVKPDGTRKKLEQGREQAFLSRRLVALAERDEVPIEEERWRFSGLDRDRAQDRMLELELKSLLTDPVFSEEPPLGADEPAPERDSLDYQLVGTEEELAHLCDLLQHSDCFAVDTETTSLDPFQATLLGISFSCRRGQGFYVPLAHQNNPLDGTAALEKLRPLLADQGKGKIGQNLKFECSIFGAADIPFQGVLFDTLIAAYLLDPGVGRYKLEYLAQRFLGREMIAYRDLVPDEEQTLLDVDLERVAEYAAEDAEVAWSLYEELAPRLEDEGLQKLFQEVEMPLVPVLSAVERAGVAVNKHHFTTLNLMLDKRITGLEQQIYQAAGEEFNLNSPRQLSTILFERMGIPPVKKTKTGYSTDENVLLELAADHPIAAELLEYRKLYKLKHTYVDVLPTLTHPVTGRIHSSFNQTVTSTGRLSSSDPNLQNIPIRDDLGREVRKGFVPTEGCLLLGADYSQVELRILAALSGDSALQDAFAHDVDVHARTACRIFNTEEDQVDREMRTIAKAVNFGVIYGQTAYGLARELKISRQEAQSFIDAYFGLYNGVHSFVEHLVDDATKKGLVRTWFGRMRRIEALSSRNRMVRAQGERLAVNTVIQGTAADLIKIAMVGVARMLEERSLASRLILQVHDELLLEVPFTEKEQLPQLLETEMLRPWPFELPLRVSVAMGSNWEEAH